MRAEVLEQLLAVSEAKDRVVFSKYAAAASEEQLALAEGRYRAGVATLLELDDAQISRTNAQAQHVQAQYDLDIARARLLRATGKGL